MKVKLDNVRLAFPDLWEARAFAGEGGGEPKFGASFLFPADHPAVALLEAAFEEAAKEKWGPKAAATLKQLKAEAKTKSIPVIAVTASAMTYNRQTMMAEGFDGYQAKPISLKDFLGEIERVLVRQAS